MAQRLRLPPDSLGLGLDSATQSSLQQALLLTARSALNGHLSVSSRLLRHVIDSLAEGVIVANLEGRFVLFNPAAEHILSLGLRDVPLSEWSSVYGCFRPDTVSPFPAEELPLARALRGETVDDCEIFIRKNGGPAGGWISVNSRPIVDGGGHTLGGVVTFRDITAAKQQLERQQLLSKIVEDTADAVLVTDSTGNIEYVNAAFEQMTGFTRAEVLGKNPRLLKSDHHSRSFYEGLWEKLLRGDVFRDIITDRRKSGELYLSSQSITPLKSPDGAISHLVSIARDVTERQRAMALENGLRLARQVQQRLFPTSPPNVPGLDTWGVSIPAHATGGDYFDFLTLPCGSLALVIGDVSGHGFDSAILMAQTRALVRAAARRESDPARILAEVNALLVPDLGENRFIGMIIVAIDARSGGIRYANAGHAPGYVLDQAGGVKMELASTGVVLGLFDDAAFTTERGPALEPGDLLVLFTDGVTEAEDADGRMCGAEWALDIVRSRAHLSSAEILAALCETIRTFTPEGSQQDDITAVVCRVGSRERRAARERRQAVREGVPGMPAPADRRHPGSTRRQPSAAGPRRAPGRGPARD
jgi:phosphoserine phosphatase RsbU/P